jgi:hypothetical protein
MGNTARLGLPLIASGQAQKDVTHNEALLALDRLVALVVQSRSVNAPPMGAQAGQCWIVPAMGGWNQPAGTLMHWDGLGWVAAAPVPGQMAWIADEGGAVIFDGSWRAGWPVTRLLVGARTLFATPAATVAPPSGGPIIDAESRAVLTNLIAALQAQGVLA